MLNNIILIGRLTADPELRYTSKGTAVASWSLAVERNYKNADGQKEADFINIQAWRATAENCAQHLHRGELCAVDGSLHIDTYQAKDGTSRKAAVVVADAVYFLSPIKQPGPARQTKPEPLADDDLPF